MYLMIICKQYTYTIKLCVYLAVSMLAFFMEESFSLLFLYKACKTNPRKIQLIYKYRNVISIQQNTYHTKIMTPIGTINAAIAPLSEDIQQLQSYNIN